MGLPKIDIDANLYPESAAHIADYLNFQFANLISPEERVIFTYENTEIDRRRQESAKAYTDLNGDDPISRIVGFDRDEFPFAAFEEGGLSASSRPIPADDNQQAGSSFGNQLNNFLRIYNSSADPIPNGTDIDFGVINFDDPLPLNSISVVAKPGQTDVSRGLENIDNRVYFYGNERDNRINTLPPRITLPQIDNRGDVVFAGAGRDRVFGTGSRDVLFGQSGDDFLIGGDGADFLIGGEGVDRLIGNNNASVPIDIDLSRTDDRFLLDGRTDYAQDFISGFDVGSDILLLQSSQYSSVEETYFRYLSGSQIQILGAEKRNSDNENVSPARDIVLATIRIDDLERRVCGCLDFDRDITDEDINLLGIKREIFNSTGRDPITGVPLPPFRQY